MTNQEKQYYNDFADTHNSHVKANYQITGDKVAGVLAWINADYNADGVIELSSNETKSGHAELIDVPDEIMAHQGYLN